jgi:iron complex transport system substrate-binding protein
MVLAVAGAILGCQKRPVRSAPPAKSPTVASLVPAATDLIVGMGAGNHLVAVSNFDRDPQTANLPRVGDYQQTDWEKLAGLRPNLIVTQFDPGHTPAGFSEQRARIGATQINLKIERLSDIDLAVVTLGTAIEESAKAAALTKRIGGELESVRARVAGLPSVRTLLVVGATGLDVAGRDTFLDDLLIAAGGQNATRASRYVSIDREALAALNPQAILQLLPDADQRTVADARAFWDTFPEISAVKEHRVWQLTQTFIMQPGSHVAEAAAIFAQKLHLEASVPSTTQTSR